MPSNAPVSFSFDWIPTSVPFVFGDAWHESALLPGESTLEAALKEIIRKTGCNMLEVFPRDPAFKGSDDGKLWRHYIVGLCWDGLLRAEEEVELRIPQTVSAKAIDGAAAMSRMLKMGETSEVPNYFVLSFEPGKGYVLEAEVCTDYSYGVDGYPI